MMKLEDLSQLVRQRAQQVPTMAMVMIISLSMAMAMAMVISMA